VEDWYNFKLTEFSYGDYITLGFTVIFATILMCLPMYIWCRFSKLMKDNESSDHSFLIDIDLKGRPRHNLMGYPIQFFMRRLIMVLVAIMFKDHESGQSFVQIVHFIVI